MALTVLDASVLIALLDPDDALHSAAKAATARAAADELVVPASALAESLVVPARVGRLEEVRAAIEALGPTIAPIDEEVAVLAASLRAKHGKLRLPDALVIALADSFQAGSLLTGDSRWEGISKSVKVVK